MKNSVLLLGTEQTVLLQLKSELDYQGRPYDLVISGSIHSAITKIESGNISVLVFVFYETFPKYSALLTFLAENYPDISIILVGKDREKSGSLSKTFLNIRGYLSQPIEPNELHKKIISILDQHKDGGTIEDVSLASFLQMLEMEGKTCTLRIRDLVSMHRGTIFMKEGKMIQARSHGSKGLAAAKDMISWERVHIEIENSCYANGRESLGNLRAIILDSMREKDEERGGDPEYEIAKSRENGESHKEILKKIDSIFSGKWRPDRIYRDPYWEDFTKRLNETGLSHGLGMLKAAYIQIKNGSPLVVVNSHDVFVLDVGSACPRDKLLRNFID